MIPEPVVLYLGGMNVVSEHDPPGSATESETDPAKLGFPAVVSAERVGQRASYRGIRLAVPAEVVEVELVQHDGTRTHQMLALQVVVDVRRCIFVLQSLGELLLHDRQRFDRTAIVVLPMGANQPLGEPVKLGRVEAQRLERCRRGKCRRCKRSHASLQRMV